VFFFSSPSLLLDDGVGIETTISYPTSMEALGRGIDLIQSGTTVFVQQNSLVEKSHD
jgi:hypothetical protein